MLYYEDMVPGESVIGPALIVDLNEMREFAKEWDPLPQHIDDEVGKEVFGSLTAPGLYILALKQRLIHRMEEKPAVIASFGYDQVRFHKAVRPNDSLTLNLEWIKRRLSKSRKEQGIVTVHFSLRNQDHDVVMSHLDTVLVRCRR